MVSSACRPTLIFGTFEAAALWRSRFERRRCATPTRVSSELFRPVPNCPWNRPVPNCSIREQFWYSSEHFVPFLRNFLPRVRLRSASGSFIVDFTPQNDLLSLQVTDFFAFEVNLKKSPLPTGYNPTPTLATSSFHETLRSEVFRTVPELFPSGNTSEQTCSPFSSEHFGDTSEQFGRPSRAGPSVQIPGGALRVPLNNNNINQRSTHSHLQQQLDIVSIFRKLPPKCMLGLKP